MISWLILHIKNLIIKTFSGQGQRDEKYINFSFPPGCVLNDGYQPARKC